MSGTRVDEAFAKWQALRAQGRLVLPEWLCDGDADLKKELDQRIDALQAAQRRQTLPRALFAAASPEDELAHLLRSRLRWLGIVFPVWWGLWGICYLYQSDNLPFEWFDTGVHYFNALCTLLLSGLLWSRRKLTLKQLRAIELLIFGFMVLDIGWDHYRYLDERWLDGVAAPGAEDKVMDLYGDSMALPWVLVMMVYAMYIPSTWKRSMLIMGVMAAIAIVLTLPFVFGSDEVSVNLLHYSLRDLVIWLVVAGLLAMWGTAKMATVRQEARAAREYGQYRLKRQLRRGGMGELFLAEHRLIHRPCVIKIIHPDKAADRRAPIRFEREVHTLATLTHWNIVQVYDYGTTAEGQFYYVMEYLPGLDLADLVAEAGPLPAGRVVHFLRQACAALNEAHASGLIHRDIKPQNIIATERGRVFDVIKLLDFGLVREVIADAEDDRLTRDGALVGTPAYMSPEQAGGDTNLDGRSDLYSLGAVAYFLLTGQPPFERKNVQQVVRAHLVDPVVPPSSFAAGLPADLEAIVLKCLAKKPEARYASAAELEAALGACSAAQTWSSAQAADWWRAAMLRGAPG